MSWPATDELIERIRTATAAEIDEIGRYVTALLLESFRTPGFHKVLAEVAEIGVALHQRADELSGAGPAPTE